MIRLSPTIMVLWNMAAAIRSTSTPTQDGAELRDMMLPGEDHHWWLPVSSNLFMIVIHH